MDILWKGVIGGLITAFIAWLAKQGSVLPGILPLFPTFAVIALYLVGQREDTPGFQQTCHAAIKTLPAYFVFLVTCYLGIKALNFKITIALGLAAWLITTLIVFFGPKYL
jgi:uncharacterized membrane protein (GlpM family)